MKSTKLAQRGTVQTQMQEVEHLRASDPELFGVRFALGDKLVRYCEGGALRKVVDAVTAAADGDILFYFAVKMFRNALVHGHMMIASFLLDQGFPLHASGLPNPLVDALGTVEDHRAVSIAEFLVLGKGMDVNVAPSPTWFTPLHVAAQRGLADTVAFLVANGADVNAVAAGDAMPLTLAEALAPSATRDTILDLLMRKGAKSTWRKGTAGVTFASFSGGGGGGGGGGGTFSTCFNPSVQSSMVSFKGGAVVGSTGGTASSVTVEYAADGGGLVGLLGGQATGTTSSSSSGGPRTTFSATARPPPAPDATADGKEAHTKEKKKPVLVVSEVFAEHLGPTGKEEEATCGVSDDGALLFSTHNS
jgi:hypothetical protein